VLLRICVSAARYSESSERDLLSEPWSNKGKPKTPCADWEATVASAKPCHKLVYRFQLTSLWDFLD
jgi:hypothetical protein